MPAQRSAPLVQRVGAHHRRRGPHRLAKEPVPGRVKTRLCPPCTPVQAAAVADGGPGGHARRRPRLRRRSGGPGARRAARAVVPARRGGGRPGRGPLDRRLTAAWAAAASGPAVQIGMDTPAGHGGRPRRAPWPRSPTGTTRSSAPRPTAAGGRSGCAGPTRARSSACRPAASDTGARQRGPLTALGLRPADRPTAHATSTPGPTPSPSPPRRAGAAVRRVAAGADVADRRDRCGGGGAPAGRHRRCVASRDGRPSVDRVASPRRRPVAHRGRRGGASPAGRRCPTRCSTSGAARAAWSRRSPAGRRRPRRRPQPGRRRARPRGAGAPPCAARSSTRCRARAGGARSSCSTATSASAATPSPCCARAASLSGARAAWCWPRSSRRAAPTGVRRSGWSRPPAPGPWFPWARVGADGSATWRAGAGLRAGAGCRLHGAAAPVVDGRSVACPWSRPAAGGGGRPGGPAVTPAARRDLRDAAPRRGWRGPRRRLHDVLRHRASGRTWPSTRPPGSPRPPARPACTGSPRACTSSRASPRSRCCWPSCGWSTRTCSPGRRPGPRCTRSSASPSSRSSAAPCSCSLSGTANVARWYPWTLLLPAGPLLGGVDHHRRLWSSTSAPSRRPPATRSAAARGPSPRRRRPRLTGASTGAAGAPVPRRRRRRRRRPRRRRAHDRRRHARARCRRRRGPRPAPPALGPQGLPVNKTARRRPRGRGRPRPALPPGGRRRRRPRAVALGCRPRAWPQRRATLPIACVEGWSARPTWPGSPCATCSTWPGARDRRRGRGRVAPGARPLPGQRARPRARRPTATRCSH